MYVQCKFKQSLEFELKRHYNFVVCPQHNKYFYCTDRNSMHCQVFALPSNLHVVSGRVPTQGQSGNPAAGTGVMRYSSYKKITSGLPNHL